MLTIHYPEPRFQRKTEEGSEFIFDSLRKKWLQLTPEEWVRQNFVSYLINGKQYPSSFIALEKSITVGEMKKRFDVLVYNSLHQAWMMIECKAPSVVLDEKTLHQLLRYHIAVPVEYLIITNGATTYGWKKETQGLVLLNELPAWPSKL